jgi:hypothetical protein
MSILPHTENADHPPPCLAAALDYLARGWSVVAVCPPDHAGCSPKHLQHCKRPGKAPLGRWKHYQDRLPTQAEVEKMWRDHPNANVGLVLGPVSGLIALDIDGPAGKELLRRLSGGDLPRTLAFRTPGDGGRLLYRWPAGLDPKNHSFRDDNGREAIKVLARGGHTVMPPSRHANGGTYKWAPGWGSSDTASADCPAWLRDWLQAISKDHEAARAVPLQADRTAPHGAPLHQGPSPPDPVARATAYLRHSDPAISGQRGHDQTFKVACALVHGFHLSDAEALAVLRDWNQTCQPPWSENELAHKVTSARKHGNYHNLLSELPSMLPKTLNVPSNGQTGKHVPVANCVTLAAVETKPVEWLWPGWIPLGKMAMLDGDPDLGKSTLLLDLAARVSTNAAMPDGSVGTPGGVLLLSAEDDPEDTIKPRLLAAGADLTKIHIITAIDGHPPTLPRDLPAIEARMIEHHIRLLLIDPLIAYLAGDACSDQDVRKALHPIAMTLGRRACSALSLRHLNKGGGTKAMYRGGGSIGIIGAARAGMLVAQDPDDPKGRVLAQTKHNLAAGRPSLRYTLEWVDQLQACRLVWRPAPSPYSADDLLHVAQGQDPEGKTAKEEAKAFLKQFLADGPKPATAVYEQGKKIKLGESTLRKAKAELGVLSTADKQEGQYTGWVWSLPEGTGNTGLPDVT